MRRILRVTIASGFRTSRQPPLCAFLDRDKSRLISRGTRSQCSIFLDPLVRTGSAVIPRLGGQAPAPETAFIGTSYAVLPKGSDRPRFVNTSGWKLGLLMRTSLPLQRSRRIRLRLADKLRIIILFLVAINASAEL
jgi:hypothetical protein